LIRTPLHLASIRGHVNIARVLVEAGADVNAQDFDMMTPLHYASEYGQNNVIIYLVKEANAAVNVKNKYGQTPFDIA